MLKKFLFFILSFCSFAIAFAAVNINSASQQDFETLNGIGPSKAKAIVDYRTQHGPFKTVEDIKGVKGIGDKTFDKIKGELTLSGASSKTTTTATPAKKDTTTTNSKPAKKDSADSAGKKVKPPKTDKDSNKKPAASKQ